MTVKILTCATCGRKARLSGPEAPAAAQAAGWRYDLRGTTAWCGDHADDALSGKSTSNPPGTEARF